MRQFIKQFLPESFLRFARPYYHGLVALVANWYFGQPSNNLVVIGVTGTKGKTTAANLIAAITEQAGYSTGLATTAVYKLDSQTVLNPYKMSTVSEWMLHRWLSEMKKNGKQVAVLELTSEGLAQNRHAGINIDIAVFTNLTPEHLDSHGSFENYRVAKAKLFRALRQSPVTAQKRSIIPDLKKTIVANVDDENGQYFLNFKADQYLSFGTKRNDATVVGSEVAIRPEGISFAVKPHQFSLQLKGQFDVYNALAAIATARALGIDDRISQTALNSVPVVPGRMEVIQSHPATVVVDYAHEPTGMHQLYDTVARWPHQRIIHVLGPTGGGRDNSHKTAMGKFVGQKADMVIITTDDPYDDDPATLADLMVQGALQAGKQLHSNVFVELDRKQAIIKAVRLARSGDLVLITGKGSEQKMVLAHGRMIDWDDRTIAREAVAGVQA